MTISLRRFLDTPDRTYLLVEVHKMLSTAQANVTFWGRRVVRVAESNECVTLDKVARKIIAAARLTDISGDMELSERIAGMDITSQMFEFYRITDGQINRSNFFTKIVVYIRELLCGSEKSQFQMGSFFNGWQGDSCECGFRTYNRTTLTAAFGPPPHSQIRYSESLSSGTYRVGERNIRELVKGT